MPEWGPPQLQLQLPPQHGVHLLAWGSDPAGRWWALLTWERHIARNFETPTELWCSGWAAAQYVERIDHEDYGRVPRVRLDGDPRWWPIPPGPRLGYFGVLEHDTALDPPRVTAGPAPATASAAEPQATGPPEDSPTQAQRQAA